MLTIRHPKTYSLIVIFDSGENQGIYYEKGMKQMQILGKIGHDTLVLCKILITFSNHARINVTVKK